MRTVLRSRNFARLWLAQLVSQIGDMVLIIALPFYVYQISGSLLQTGLMYIVETLPRILFGSFAGVFVDRWDRRRTMIVSDLGRSALLLLLLLARSPHHLSLIYAIAGIQSFISLFFNPALAAITPALVPEQHLVAANSLQSLSEALMRLVGPPLGGALLALVGLTGVVLTDSISFIFSACMLGLIVVPHTPGNGTASTQSVAPSWTAVSREWLDGLRFVRESSILTGIFVTYGIFALSQGLSAAPLIAFVKEVMGGTALTLGWMAMAQGVGSVLGTLVIGRVSKVMPAAFLVGMPLVVAGCCVLLFVNVPALAVAVPLIALIGVFIVGFFVTTQTLVQINVQGTYRGRVSAALGMITSLMSLLGMLIASTLGDRAGSVRLLDSSGTVTAMAGVWALLVLGHARLQQGQPGPEKERSSAM